MTEESSELVPVNQVQRKRPVGRPPVHGGYSQFQLGPLTEAKIKQINEILKGERLAIAPTDVIFINTLGRLLAQMEILDRWYEERGMFQDVGRGLLWPTVPHYLNLAKQVARQLEQLGLTPTARYKMGKMAVQTQDIASKLAQARNQ